MWRVWKTFFFRPVSALPLSIFRICFGLYLLVYYVRLGWFLEMYYGEGGLFASQPFMAGLRAGQFTLFGAFSANIETIASILYPLTILSAILFTLGACTRFTAAANWILNVSWLAPISAGTNGGDQVLSVACFLFMVAGVAGHLNRSISVDGFFRSVGRAKVSPLVPVWSMRLFQIQLAFIYFYAGFHKMFSADWYEGVAMHYVYNQSIWGTFDLSFASNYPVLIGLMTYGTLLFELIIFPVLVWLPATRIFALVSGVMFHLGIGLTMKVFVFCSIMPLIYLSFLTIRDYQRIAGILRKGVAWFRESPAASRNPQVHLHRSESPAGS